MKILIDGREKSNFHILKRLNEQKIEWECRKLNYGDYSFELNGKSYEKEIMIERKASLTELSGNFCRGRIKFETEFAKMKADNCKGVLMVEDVHAREKMKLRIQYDLAGMDTETKWRKTWRTNMTGNSMVASIRTFKDRYDLDLIFCSKACSVKEILKVFENYLGKKEDADGQQTKI